MDIHITAIFLYFMFKTCSGEVSCNFTFPHGHIRLSSCKGQSEDSMCQYTCDEDYKKHTFMTHVPCWTSILWSHVIGDKLCTLKRCSEIIVPNGELSTSCTGTIGSSCGYTCHRGFQRDDKISSIYCENSTNWNANLHTLCTKKICPVTIPNGYISSSCSRENGSYCYDYGCNRGYIKAPESPRLKCNASALWDWTRYEAKQLCIDEEELCPPIFSCGKIDRRCSLHHGVNCSYSCNPGCTKSSITLLRCRDNGTWDYDTDLICNCGPPCNHTIPHGYVAQWCNTFSVYCPYYCDEGYRKNNFVRLVYCNRGTWMNSWPFSVTFKDLCRAKSCSRKIRNGKLSLPCDGKVGSSCSYTCDAGYKKKIGVSSIKCTITTLWSEDPSSLCTRVPVCRTTISNGWIAESCKNRSHTSVCPFECNKDCSARNHSLVCQANGKWHNQDLACSCKAAGDNTGDVLVKVGCPTASVVIIITVVYIVVRVKSRKRRRILNEQERTNRGANFTAIPTIPRVTTSIPISTRRQERQRFMNEWEQMRPNQGVNFRTRPTEEVTFSIPNAGERILNEGEQERTSQGANLQSRSTETVTTSIPNDVRRFLNECGQERTNQWANLWTRQNKRVTFRITNEGRRIPNELGQERTNQTSQGMNFRTGSAERVTTSIPISTRRQERQRFMNEWEQMRPNQGVNFRTRPTEEVTFSIPNAGERILNEGEQERTSQGANLQSRSTETVTTSIPNDVRRFLNECGQERTNQWANLWTRQNKRVTFRITKEGRRIPNELGQERTNQTSQGMNFRTGSAERVTTSIPNNARRVINELEQERANHGANFRTWSTERVTTSTPHVSFGPNADGQIACSTTTESYFYNGTLSSSSQLSPNIDIMNAAPPEYTSHESPEHGYTAITDTTSIPHDPPPSYEETTAHPAYFKL